MKYEQAGYQSYRDDAKNGTERIANFVAEIIKETKTTDGMNSTTTLTIVGKQPPRGEDQEPQELPEIEVTAEEFSTMNWPMKRWGVRCIIMPVSGAKDDLRTMIQSDSDPERCTVFRFTGWTDIEGKPAYLHAGGAIRAKGNDPSVTVALPPELMRYDLTCSEKPADSVWASLQLLDLSDKSLTWPLLAATLAPLYGPCDFLIHVTGRTGSFKSELAALYQSHYGAKFDSRNLPGSWSSTQNANQALAFLAKNAVFVVDDFVPVGTSWQQRALQGSADALIRAQGNQSGRARLTDASNLQQTMYPRGLIFSTGEDTPEGHSARGRMLIRELSPGDIDPADLTTCQAAKPMYCGTVAWLAQSLCKVPGEITERANAIRAEQRAVGHSRTPGIVGRLIAVAEDFLQRAENDGILTASERLMFANEARDSILKAGHEQTTYLEEADPVDMFTAAVRQVLASGGGHIRGTNGGVPRNAELLGWTKERSAGEIAGYKSRGPCVGWANVMKDELYIDIAAGYAVIKKTAGAELALSKQVLFKRLKDSGALLRTDETRSRNTIRVTCENHPRQVLCMSLTTTLAMEKTSDDDDEYTDDEDDDEAA